MATPMNNCETTIGAITQCRTRAGRVKRVDGIRFGVHRGVSPTLTALGDLGSSARRVKERA
jgi:hypothetical protein